MKTGRGTRDKGSPHDLGGSGRKKGEKGKTEEETSKHSPRQLGSKESCIVLRPSFEGETGLLYRPNPFCVVIDFSISYDQG